MSELARMLKTYKIDIALVFNLTKSMEPYIERLKKDIRKMPAEVRYTFEKEGRTVESLRIKVIDFGDYGVDGSDAIRQTRFFDTETETDQLADAVNNIKYRRCGGVPNNGLEALYEAMTSDWIELKPNGRHIIVLVTDVPPLNLGERANCIGYDKDKYPRTLDELDEAWAPTDLPFNPKLKINPLKSCLFLFAPKDTIEGRSWDKIAKWERVIPSSVEPGKGFGFSIVDDLCYAIPFVRYNFNVI